MHEVVRDHLKTFLAQAAILRDGEGLPGFVEEEFRRFLRCGALGGGFARFRCTDCGYDRRVPFSCRAVVGRTLRAILGFLRRRARDAGVRDGRSGAVVIVQRFGGALNLNIHVHALVIDGVFSRKGDTVRFHPGSTLDSAGVADVLATVDAYLQRLLTPRGSEATTYSAESFQRPVRR